MLGIRQSQQALINDDESIQEGFVAIKDALTSAMGYPNDATPKLDKNDNILSIINDISTLLTMQPERADA